MKQKICGNCGKQFVCCGSIPCWCTFQMVSSGKLQWLRENFRDCVCEACLNDD